MWMRLVSAFIAVSLLGCIAAAAFWIGRRTAPAPRFATSADPGGDALAAAWADVERAQRETLALLRDHDFFGDDGERAEAYRDLLYATSGAIHSGALLDPDFPRFVRAADWNAKGGLDNPDAVTWVARLRDDAEYRVTGTRGSAAALSLQLLAGEPGVGEAATSATLAALDQRSLVVEPDGRFALIVGRRDPGAGRNWLRMAEGAATLLVRYSHVDWEAERPGALAIERVGAEGASAPPIGSEEMAARLRAVATILFDRESTWLDQATRAWTFLPRNGVTEVRPSAGGLAGHYAAFGSFELEADEALLLTTHASDAAYQGVQLGNLWFTSLDYQTRTSSLTTAQAHRSADGRYHFVVSRGDPGIQNWLDPEGHRRGVVMLRWEGLARPPGADAQPRARRVAFERLAEVLPADTPAFGPAQRAEQIRLRRARLQRRGGG